MSFGTDTVSVASVVFQLENSITGGCLELGVRYPQGQALLELHISSKLYVINSLFLVYPPCAATAEPIHLRYEACNEDVETSMQYNGLPSAHTPIFLGNTGTDGNEDCPGPRIVICMPVTGAKLNEGLAADRQSGGAYLRQNTAVFNKNNRQDLANCKYAAGKQNREQILCFQSLGHPLYLGHDR
jgi:hypothetical protein